MSIEGNKPLAILMTIGGAVLLFGSKPIMISIGLKFPVLVAAIAFGTAIGILFVVIGIISLFKKQKSSPQFDD